MCNIPETQQFLPSLTKILLFHSDVIRIAAKPALVQIVKHPDDPARTSLRAEFYRSADDARTSIRFRGDNVRAEILGESGMHKVLPVALAEYCITQAEGFNSRSLPQDRQPPRWASAGRSLLALHRGPVQRPDRSHRLTGRSAATSSLAAGVLRWIASRVELCGAPTTCIRPTWWPCSATGSTEKTRLAFASPHDEAFWRPPRDTSRRFYLAAERHSGSLALRVPGFMSKDVYTNILGEHELELKRVQS